jgi:hypothetical protein
MKMDRGHELSFPVTRNNQSNDSPKSFSHFLVPMNPEPGTPCQIARDVNANAD